MAINTLVTIKDSITAFADGHGQLQGRVIFEADDHRSAYITEENTYPLLFVAPIDVAVNRAMNVHTLRVYVYERINDDRLDVWENANDTSLILRDIRVWWNDYGVDDINIVEDPIGQFGCDKELDNLVGYFADIRFEIPSHGRCQVPVDVEPIPAPSCADATQVITDSDGNELYSNSIPSGTTETQVIEDSKAFLKDTLGTTISTTSILAEGSEDIIAPNSTYLVEYVNGTDIQSGSIVSGGSVTVQVPNPITCADATVNVNGAFWDSVPSGGTENVIVRQSSGSTQVGSKQGQYWRIADSTAVLKTTGGTTISTTSIKAEASANIVAPNTTIEVNGTTEGTFNAGSTVDVQLSDSGGVVTPDSVTVVGNDVQIVLADAVGAPVGATLMKTGQTTSYRTGDDGDIEAGRATSFTVLASNNPFGNTNRFTDILGGQTYTLPIVVDWSTYDGSTVLCYTKNLSTGALKNWADCIDQAAATSIGSYTSGWRLTNRKEIENIMRFAGTTLTVFNYAPFNQSVATNIWTSTTYVFNTNNAHCLASSGDGNFTIAVAKTIALAQYYAVRTFTVTGTTLT